MEPNLKIKSINSVIWSAIERFSVQGIQFLLNLVVARLVSPSDYGLIAMLGIFLAIGQSFVDSGFTNALIQKQNRTNTDFCTVFYFNIIIATLIYTLLYFLSPYIASFYRVPELEVVTKWISLGLIISSFSTVQQAKLTINLNFKKQAKLSLFAVVLSGIGGISLAWTGYGVWALVFQALSRNIIYTALLWLSSDWKPRLIFSWDSFNGLFGFGFKLLLGGIIHTIYTNLYTLVIGRKFSSLDVGFYNRAQTLAAFPSENLTTVITRAIYPIQCQIQDDEEQLTKTFIQYLRLTIFIIFPLLICLSILAKPLLSILLTEKWVPASEYLSILCLAYMCQPIQYINWQIITVKGRTDLTLKAEIVKKIIAFTILFITIPFGIKVMCWGLLLYGLCDICIIIFFVKKVIKVGYLTELKNIIPILLLSLAMGFLVYISTLFTEILFLKLLLGIVTSIVSYVALAYLFKFKESLFFISLLNK